MSEEEHMADIDISEIMENSEQYIDSENPEHVDADTSTIEHDSEVNNSESNLNTDKKSLASRADIKSTRLPIARVKHIMKMDPDVLMINTDAAFLVTKATELFLETLAKETYAYTANKKRKIITKKDLDSTINMVDSLCFLEGTLDV